MEITSISKHYVTITADAGEVVDSVLKVPGNFNRKFFVSSFQGDGTLETSDDQGNWIDTLIEENQAPEMQNSLQRYFRINGTGTKTIHLVRV